MLGDHVYHKVLCPLVCSWHSIDGAFPTSFLKHLGSLPSLKPPFFPDTDLLMAAAQCQEGLPLAVICPLQL